MPAPRIPVCAIGASAGGVEAIQQLFHDLPPDLGLAYIVAMHLAPDDKSGLPAMLARWTTMPVVQVAGHDQKTLAPDHVYVLPPDRSQRAAIDLFFRSVAAEHGDGFAVVLSGTGSDGVIGAKAVKERGGLVLIQDPYDAAHGGRPRAGIATSAADLVLPMSELTTRLAELARARRRIETLTRPPNSVGAIPADDEAALEQVLDVVRARTGHDFSGYTRGTLLHRVSRRMLLSDHVTIGEYLTFVRHNAAEAHTLFSDLLIALTTFFRDPDAWERLQALVITPLVAETPADEPIRVWVPGCATGEEAYTLAMLFQEAFDRADTVRELIIFASDMDRGALAIARDGIYSQGIATDVSGQRLERFFRHDGDHYRVVPDLRGHIVFTAHDLLRDPPFSRQQLISCRNVLRLLDAERKAQAMNLFRYACARQGCLFLGSSERADDNLFDALDEPHHIYRARADARIAMPRPPERRSFRNIDARAAGERPAVSRPSEMHAEALEEIAPPTVLLDSRWNVLHMSATASRFFEQSAGTLAIRVTDLVRPELRHPLHVLLLRAAGQSSPQVSPFVVVRFEHTSRLVAMMAQQRPRPDRPPHVLLTFLDMGETAKVGPDQAGDLTVNASLRASLHAADQRVENLREEGLFTTEELRAANEEMQSLTEEFHSTTEELETSKEELQSTNEELQTVNQELRLKLDELSRAHSDLENLMAATNIATLFLGCDLRIRWFTRQLADLVHDQGSRSRSAHRRSPTHAQSSGLRSRCPSCPRDVDAD